MGKRISSQTRGELLEAVWRRYCRSSKRDETSIRDEFAALRDYHRKHRIYLPNRAIREPRRHKMGVFAIVEYMMRQSRKRSSTIDLSDKSLGAKAKKKSEYKEKRAAL